MKSARGTVGDERLRAVDDEFVTVTDRRRADSGDVGPGARLGDRQAAHLLALQPRLEVALLLLLGAEQVDRRQHHVGLHREGHVRPARARVAHALGPNQRVVVVAALAAVLLREAEADVRARDIEAVLDDGGGDEHVRFAADEFQHHFFELVFAHLAVADHDARFRNEAL